MTWHRPVERKMAAQLGGGVIRDEERLCVGPVWREGRELTFPLPDDSAPFEARALPCRPDRGVPRQVRGTQSLRTISPRNLRGGSQRAEEPLYDRVIAVLDDSTALPEG